MRGRKENGKNREGTTRDQKRERFGGTDREQNKIEKATEKRRLQSMKRPCTFHTHCLSLKELTGRTGEEVVIEKNYFKTFWHVMPSSVEHRKLLGLVFN